LESFWVKAEPAADLADLLELSCLKVFEAAVAANAPVTLEGDFWLSAEPAADFAALLELSFFSTFDAADAALLLVTSFFAMKIYL
jgi:hypothetical protein